MRILIAAALALLTACTNSNDLSEPPVDLGNFLLGHNVVVASKAQMGPLSRAATSEEWEAAVKKAIDERFGRYDGTNYYHIGVSIEGYVIAQPGIPLVMSPKSILIFNVTLWDDAQGKKLIDKPEQITVFESLSGGTLVGTGYTMSKEEQMENLARNAAKAIQNWLEKNREWFGEAPGPAVAATPAPAATAAAPAQARTAPAAAGAPAARTAPAAAAPAASASTGAAASQVFAPVVEPDVIGPRGVPSGG